jgi:hypothetical protein
MSFPWVRSSRRDRRVQHVHVLIGAYVTWVTEAKNLQRDDGWLCRTPTVCSVQPKPLGWSLVRWHRAGLHRYWHRNPCPREDDPTRSER